jgi:hypothetical protein
MEKVTAYKGFEKNWKCRDFQYEIGKTYTHDGAVEACVSGFHACEYPLDVFSYYLPAESNFAIVEQSGRTHKKSGDSKVVSSKIKIKAAIDFAGIVKAAIEYTMSRAKPTCASSNTGDYGASSNTGDYGASSNTGDCGASSNTGYKGASSNTGNYGASSNTGYKGASSNTGYKGASSNTGYKGASSNTGNYGASSNTGDYGASSNTGDCGASSNTGKHGVAASFGANGKAMSEESGAIVCVYRNEKGELIHIKASKVGENGIKAGTFYCLDENGNFVEAQAC